MGGFPNDWLLATGRLITNSPWPNALFSPAQYWRTVLSRVSLKMKPSRRKSPARTPAQQCPVCGQAVNPNPRYPRYLCRVCAAQATDAAGRKLEFNNTDIGGGFEAVYADTGKVRASHICFVKGIRCWADEARFGGIVIEVFTDLDEQNLKARACLKASHQERESRGTGRSTIKRVSHRQFIRDLNKVSAETTSATEAKERFVWEDDDIEFLDDTTPETPPAIARDLAKLARSLEKLRSRILKRLGGANWLEKLPTYDPLRSPVGYFGILDLGLRETAHTRMLGWLMDPSGDHGFNDILLRAFLQEAFKLRRVPELSDARIDCETVNAESRDRLDICMQGRWSLSNGKSKSWLVIVEAKIDAGEGEDQCARYEKQCRERIASSDRHALVFLTPNGRRPETGPTDWKPCTFIRLMAQFRTQLPNLTGKPGFDVLRHYMTGVLKDLYQLNCGRIGERDDLFRISEYLSLPIAGAKSL